MSRTGLILRPVSAARVAHALDQNPDQDENVETMLDLGRWQPNWVFASTQHKRIALADLCRSADGLPNQLTAAGTRRQQKYYMMVEALTYYVDNRWVVHVFPWVVGIRGLLDPRYQCSP
jgi:O-methyltransferase involved in polyketide biosynthesis